MLVKFFCSLVTAGAEPDRMTLFFGSGGNDVECAAFIGLPVYCLILHVDNRRFLDGAIRRVVEIPSEVELRDQGEIVGMPSQILDVARPPPTGYG